MSTMVVTLTVEQLRALVREEVRAAVEELEAKPAPGAPLTDAEHASLRRRIARRTK